MHIRNISILSALLLLVTIGQAGPTQKTLYENTIQHLFSNTEIPDTFSIKIMGSSLEEGTALMSIVTSTGRRIYDWEFPASHLIGYDFEGDHNSSADKKAHIKKRIDEFFNDENFSNPAIKSDQEFDEDYSEQAIWKDIKSDRSAIGFYSQLEGAGCQIAYSKKRRQVVTYHCCC